MTNLPLSRFASFAVPASATRAPKATKATKPRPAKVSHDDTPSPKAKASTAPNPSRFAHMATAAVPAGNTVARSENSEAARLNRDDLARYGRIRTGAERKLTARDKAAAAARLSAVAAGRR
jgi:hypothetical protein